TSCARKAVVPSGTTYLHVKPASRATTGAEPTGALGPRFKPKLDTSPTRRPQGLKTKQYSIVLPRLALHLNRIPAVADLPLKNTEDDSFPGWRVFHRFGYGDVLLATLEEYCKPREQFATVL